VADKVGKPRFIDVKELARDWSQPVQICTHSCAAFAVWSSVRPWLRMEDPSLSPLVEVLEFRTYAAAAAQASS
jgi:hypothetical protein